MIIKINRRDCLNKYSRFPIRWYNDIEQEEEFVFPETYKSYILTLPAKSFKGQIRILSTQLKLLIELLGYDELIFLGDNEIPWLKQQNDYTPVKKATQYLVDNKIGKRFIGGLQVDLKDLPVFTKHLAWLCRSNIILPYIYFQDKGQNMLGTICQYGNVHLNTTTPKSDKLLKAYIKQTSFKFLTNEICGNNYSSSGIKGRKLKL